MVMFVCIPPAHIQIDYFCDGKLEIKLQGPYSIRYQVPVTRGSLPNFGFVTTAPTNSRRSPALLKFHRTFLNFVHFYRISKALGSGKQNIWSTGFIITRITINSVSVLLRSESQGQYLKVTISKRCQWSMITVIYWLDILVPVITLR